MNKYLNRIVNRDKFEPLNPFIYVFIYMTLVNAVGFVFLGGTSSVNASIIYQLTTAVTVTSSIPFNIWGITLLIAALGALWNIVFRPRRGNWIPSYLGFLAWFYAGMLYLVHGYIFQFMLGPVPNIYFWAWHYIRVMKWVKQREYLRSVGSTDTSTLNPE